MDISKLVKPISGRQTRLKEKVDGMSTQLSELKNPWSLFSLFLLGDDAKNGENEFKSIYKTIEAQGDDDTAEDGGYKGGNHFIAIRVLKLDLVVLLISLLLYKDPVVENVA